MLDSVKIITWVKIRMRYIMSEQTSCEYCSNLVYDEDCEGYVCDVEMDEDDYGRFISSGRKICPYFQFDNEYKIVRHQM